MNDPNYVEIQENRAMIYLPKEAIEININAVLYKNGELLKVQKILNNDDIHKAFDDADKNYIEDTDMFELTELGKRMFEEVEEASKNE